MAYLAKTDGGSGLPSAEKLADWCQDAISLLSPSEEFPDVVRVQRELVTRLSGKRQLVGYARDLAHSLSELPLSQRRNADEELRRRHGFSFDVFVASSLEAVRAIAASGRIKSSAQARKLIDFLSDHEGDGELHQAAQRLIDEWEKEQEQKKLRRARASPRQ